MRSSVARPLLAANSIKRDSVSGFNRISIQLSVKTAAASVKTIDLGLALRAKTHLEHNQISHLRSEMIMVGQKKGLTHPETIERSQVLDKLIFKFERLILNKDLEAS